MSAPPLRPRPTATSRTAMGLRTVEMPAFVERKIPSATRLKVALALFLVLMVVGLSGLVIFLVNKIFAELTPSMRVELEWKVRRGAIELAQASDLGLALSSADSLKQAFAGYRESADVIAIVALDQKDQPILIEGVSPEAPRKLFTGPAGAVRTTPGYVVSWAPAMIEGTAVGRVALVVSTVRLQSGERLRRAILGAALGACVVALTISLFFVSVFLGPLILLTQEGQRQAREMELARNIQTSILPRQLEAEALQIAAVMIPADDVGGDYYDVIPFAGGCFIGIGDVTGHGVHAGLVMLMVQSAVATLTKENPHSSPRQVLIAVNRMLYENIRSRMMGDDHVTFTLIRFEVDGRLVYSGAHEDILVCRAATGTCEALETPGTWLGAAANIEAATDETHERLAVGDVVVLYTDGITEARNASKTEFGLQRLMAVVQQHRDQTVEQIRAAVLAALTAWMAHQDDDVTLLVFRYQGPPTGRASAVRI